VKERATLPILAGYETVKAIKKQQQNKNSKETKQ